MYVFVDAVTYLCRVSVCWCPLFFYINVILPTAKLKATFKKILISRHVQNP